MKIGQSEYSRHARPSNQKTVVCRGAGFDGNKVVVRVNMHAVWRGNRRAAISQ
jgi:hypothetical protein